MAPSEQIAEQSPQTGPSTKLEVNRDLIQKFKNSQSKSDLDQIFSQYERFIHYMVRNFGGYSMPYEDLYQEAAAGFMQALQRFDPAYGVQLTTFSSYWIKNAINEYVIKNSRAVKIATTKSQRKLFFKLRAYRNNSTDWLDEQSIERVAHDLEVSVDDVKTMERRLSSCDYAYQYTADDDEALGSGTIHDASFSGDDVSKDTVFDAIDQEQARKILSESISCLSERERLIVKSRWLNEQKWTLKDLSNHLGVSQERVRQIEAESLKKLKGTLSYFEDLSCCSIQ